MTYRKLKEILNRMSDKELDCPVVAIEARDEDNLELGAEFPVKDIGTDETENLYLQIPFQSQDLR